MATGKRYYWLKLKDDFFSSKRIKKLRKLAGGDTYTIIYLKMQLLAMKTDGVIQYSGLENSFEEELALDLDEDSDNVRVTLNYLLSCGLAECSGGSDYFFPFAVENVGSESSSAQRMRTARAAQKSLPPAVGVTFGAQSAKMCAHSDGEKEIEKREKSKRVETENRDKRKKTADAFESFAGDDAELLSALRDFEKMRKQIKRPLTDRAKTMLINKLKSEIPQRDWIRALENSIMNCWQGVFPPDGSDKPRQRSTAMDDLRTLHELFDEEDG